MDSSGSGYGQISWSQQWNFGFHKRGNFFTRYATV